MIKEMMRQAQDCKKSYTDQMRYNIEFQVGDKVFVRVALYKYVIRFDRKDKLALRFMRPFKVLEHVGKVTYRLALLASISRIHNMFHALMLRKYQ